MELMEQRCGSLLLMNDQPPAIPSADLKTTSVTSYCNENLMNNVGGSFKGGAKARGTLLVDVRRTWEEMSCRLADHTGGETRAIVSQGLSFGLWPSEGRTHHLCAHE